MGVLVHPSYEDERANGVAVTTDPIYGTEGTFYLNTQLGEDLVTNPEALSVPEEVLLNAAGGYAIVRPSNQVADGGQILTDTQLDELRAYLAAIHSTFGDLYPGEGDFAMEVEFKVTSEGQVAIKQARPWVF